MGEIFDKRVLLTGVNGQVGRALKRELQGSCELITTSRTGDGADLSLDLADHSRLKVRLLELRPDIIINPAAYTAVDKAEDESEQAGVINAIAPGVMAQACKDMGALLIHYSTDYVFNGQSPRPYTEQDRVEPLNVYGETKLAGESAIEVANCNHLIFRACWVYDAEGRNFPNAILARAREMDELRVVNDQFGTPTSAAFIASITHGVLRQLDAYDLDKGSRVFHLKPEGACSWFEFAKELVEIVGRDNSLKARNIEPVSSAEFPAKAKRPTFSVLDNSKLKAAFDLDIGRWEDYVEECFSSVATPKGRTNV